MVENIRKVSNPLTIIAIFAGLTEIAGTITVQALDPAIQAIFVWFLMLFPVGLVLLFFVTLNFNRGALYAPSDYKNEDNFLSSLGRRRLLNREFDELSQQLDRISVKLADDVRTNLGDARTEQLETFQALLQTSFQEIQEDLESSRDSVEEIALSEPVGIIAQSPAQAAILQFLHRNGPSSIEQLKAVVGMNETVTGKAAEKLRKRGAIERTKDDPPTYALAKSRWTVQSISRL